MPEILIPLTFDDLPVRPALVGRPEVSDDLQQTIALLSGWDKTTRRLIKCSPSGILFAAEPPVKAILSIQGSVDGNPYQCPDIPTTEVLIKSKTGNAGDIWVNVGAVAADGTGYPLAVGEYVKIALNNLHSLSIFFATAVDYAAIVYSK